MKKIFSSLFSSNKDNSNNIEKEKRKNFDILKYDGVRAQKIGKLAYAAKCFTEAIAIQEDFETMSYLVGTYSMAHENGKALVVLDRMKELEPTHINTMFTRVSVLFLLNREEDVIAECRNIIELDSQNNIAYFLLGKAKKTLNNNDDALTDLTNAISLKSDLADPYLLRAEIYLEKGDGQSAIADIDKVFELEGDEEAAFLLRAMTCELLNNNDEAEHNYKQVLDLNPFNEKAGLKLAQLFIANNRFDEAMTLLDEIIDIVPFSASIYAERSKLRNTLGDSAGAESDMKTANELLEADEDATSKNGAQGGFNDMYKGGIY